MIIKDLIISEINKINDTNKKLLSNVRDTYKFLAEPDLKQLREHFKEQERLSELQSKQIYEIKEILNSTHYKNLSDLAKSSGCEDLIEATVELKKLMFEIAVVTNQNRTLIEDCSRITNTQLNLIIGKKQEPTNYNFSSKNINAHLLQQLKSNT